MLATCPLFAEEKKGINRDEKGAKSQSVREKATKLGEHTAERCHFSSIVWGFPSIKSA